MEEHITYSYACRKCEADNISSNITTTESPKNLINKGMASNNLLSHVIALKFLYSVPLYRQESYFKMLGANVGLKESLIKVTSSNGLISLNASSLFITNLD